MGSLEEVKKWDDLSTGQWKALGIKCGGIEAVKAILKDEMKVVVRSALKLAFDSRGRYIPRNLKAKVCDADFKLCFNQPRIAERIDSANRLLRLQEMLRIDTGVTAEEFQEESERLMAIVKNDSLIANISQGVILPVILVKRQSDDPGAEIECHLDAASDSYQSVFPGRKFHNRQKGELRKKIFIFNASGYDRVWRRKKKEDIIALFFPNPLQGFSIDAQRETMDILLDYGFTLSGAIEPWIMYPDILGDHRGPALDLSALSFWRSDYSISLETYNNNCSLVVSVNSADAHNHRSGSLLFVSPE